MIYDPAVSPETMPVYLTGSPNGLEQMCKLVPLDIVRTDGPQLAIRSKAEFKDLLAAVDLVTAEGYHISICRGNKRTSTEHGWNNTIIGFSVFDPLKYTKSRLADRRLRIVAGLGTELADPASGETTWKYTAHKTHMSRVAGHPLDGVIMTVAERDYDWFSDRNYEKLKQRFVVETRWYGYPDAIHYVEDLVWDPVTRTLSQT